MNFIELTLKGDITKKIYINPDKITAICTLQGGTYIYADDQMNYCVVENSKDIINKIINKDFFEES